MFEKKKQIPKTYMLEIRDAMPFSFVFVSFESGRELQGFGIPWHIAPFFCGAGCPKRKHRGGYLGLSRGTKWCTPLARGGGLLKSHSIIAAQQLEKGACVCVQVKKVGFLRRKGSLPGASESFPLRVAMILTHLNPLAKEPRVQPIRFRGPKKISYRVSFHPSSKCMFPVNLICLVSVACLADKSEQIFYRILNIQNGRE